MPLLEAEEQPRAEASSLRIFSSGWVLQAVRLRPDSTLSDALDG
jgi:hypothetical protein